MKKFAFSIGIIACAFSLHAASEVCTWAGAVSSDWNDSRNWQNGVRPENDDVAIFRSDASVTPPDSFRGVLQIEGAVVVTVTVSAPAEFALSLKSSSAGMPSFVKRGNGNLVLRVSRGINPGTVTVAEGNVDFAQNADGEPGAFDRIVIASGASARVVDSPFATRHGVAVKAGFMSFDPAYLPEGFGGFSNNGNEKYYYFAGGSYANGFEIGKETQSLADRLDYMWDTSFSLTSVVARCFVPTETLPALCGTNSIPQELFSAQQQTVTYTRAIVLSENENAIRRRIQNGTGTGAMSAWVLDGAEFARCAWGGETFKYDKATALSRGFHALNVSLWSESIYGWKKNWTTLSRLPLHRADTGYLTPDVLWYGVCCNALTVESGATLTIADGQALGVARTEDLTVAGQVLSTGPKACVSLLSSYALDGERRSHAKTVDGFDDFSGLIEIGRTVHVRLPDTASYAKWTLFGKGTATVVSGSEPRFGSPWTGTVDIPAGEVFDVPQTWSEEVTIVGEGAVLSGDLDVDSMTTFAGSVKLENGDSLNVSSAELLSSHQEMLPSPLDATAWTYLGTSHVAHITAPDGTVFNVEQSSLPRSEDGKLVLTWAANLQRHAAFMTGRPIAADDKFDFSFTVSASIPSRTLDGAVPPYAGVHGWTTDYRAGSFSLAFSGAEPGTLADGNRPGFLPAGSQRLQFNFYNVGSSTGPVAYFGGTPTGGRIIGPSGGVDPSKPWRMRVCGADGRALVTVMQDDLQYAIDWDIRSVFKTGENVYLALAGHSDWWNDGNNAVPWIRLEVSDFAGWISSADDRRVNLSEESNPDANMALSPANWKCAGNNSESDSAVWPDDGTLMLLPRTDVKSHTLRYAVCKSPVSADQAFELSFDLTFSKSASTSTAAVWAFYLQTEGSSPVMTDAQDNQLGEVTLKNTSGYGIGISTYGSKPYWWSGLGGTATAPILKEFEANSIKISAGKANRLTVRYDGCGLMHLRFESDGKTAEGTYFFEDLLKETKPLFLTFATGTAWANCGTIKLSNFTLTKNTADIDRLTAWPTPLVIAPGASAALNVGTVDRPPSVPQIAYDDVTLGDGSVLSVEKEPGSSATHVSLSPIVDGNACISSGTDAVVTVSDVTFVSTEPSKLSLTGAVCFADPFAVTMPLGWLDAINTEHVLIDFSAADVESSVPSQIVLKDETGSVMTARLRIVRRGNAFVLLKKGFTVILR